jgi:hypothetical protein
MIPRVEAAHARNPARGRFKDSEIARKTADGTMSAFARFVGDNDPAKITYRELDRRSGIPESTLRALAGGSAITVAQLLSLRDHLPGEAINMITEGGGAWLMPTERRTSNWWKIFSKGGTFLGEISEALEDGVVTHVEHQQLKKSARSYQAELQHLVEDG